MNQSEKTCDHPEKLIMDREVYGGRGVRWCMTCGAIMFDYGEHGLGSWILPKNQREL